MSCAAQDTTEMQDDVTTKKERETGMYSVQVHISITVYE